MWRRKIIRHIGCNHPRVVIATDHKMTADDHDRLGTLIQNALEMESWDCVTLDVGVRLEFPECSWCRKAGA